MIILHRGNLNSLIASWARWKISLYVRTRSRIWNFHLKFTTDYGTIMRKDRRDA